MVADDLQARVNAAAEQIVVARRIPRASYRMQFNHEFTFHDAEALVPYLDELGISDIYASPILKATPGSMHGYDVCDPTQLNPELGTEEDFARLCSALKARGMGLILDIVPNHMGIGGGCNPWWMDVLENGEASPYASYFDIDWEPVKPELRGKVLLAVLEDQYGNVLEGSKFGLVYDGGAFFLSYGEQRFPLATQTYDIILDLPLAYLVMKLGDDSAHVQELHAILAAIRQLPPRSVAAPEGREQQSDIKRRIATLYRASRDVREALDNGLVTLQGTPGDSASFDRLDALIEGQAYRLAFWRVASEEINYRRFFDINAMAAVRVELPEVFRDTHALVFDLIAKDQVTALRIDHPDGLWNPPGYFRTLQERYLTGLICAQFPDDDPAKVERAVDAWFETQINSSGKPSWPLYVVAEKILSETEPLPLDWAVDGTTGYDFMSLVNSLFVDNAYEADLSVIFADFTARVSTFSLLEYASKKATMEAALASEMNSLANRLERLCQKNRHARDFTRNGLLMGLREVVACLPIYRTYIIGVDSVTARDRRFIEEAVAEAKRRNPRIAEAVFDFLRDTLLLNNLDQFDETGRRGLIDFVMRLQQITPPVMAKSVEDTLFYVYNRLVSVNEVGGNPATFGITPEQFAEENTRRCRLWPHAMLATSTHDTKRSEDVRARLNMLSELPSEWGEALETWAQINAVHKIMLGGGPAPSANDEYLIYQTLLGTYPFTMDDADTYADRIVQYMAKATKEAKVQTSWTNANPAYDQAVENFVRVILASDEFLHAFQPLQKRVAYFGQFNALGQTLLKLTCPGVPDTYRGTELWDFSLVDPDNRRPVDYDLRCEFLHQLQTPDPADLLAHSEDGRIKLYVIASALKLRRAHPSLFLDAPFQPLTVEGDQRDHVCAFSRVHEGVGVLVLVPRLVARLTGGQERAPVGDVWGDTRLSLPEGIATTTYRDCFTGETLALDGSAPLSELLSRFPLGLFAFPAKAL